MHGDAREMRSLASESAHLVLTSPPYWTLKKYDEADGQLGHVTEYDKFLAELAGYGAVVLICSFLVGG